MLSTKMSFIFGFIWFYVLLNVASSDERPGDNFNWFWSKDFKDGTEHDNDPEREFFRETPNTNDYYTTKREFFTPTPGFDDDTSGSDFFPTTPSVNDDDTTEREFFTATPDSNDADDTSESEFFSSTPSTFPTSLSLNGADLSANAYYKKRKFQTLSCTENDHLNIEDEFGCQLCTCNGQGAMLCAKLVCGQHDKQQEEDIKNEHQKLLHNSVDSNLILREYATDCKPGSNIHVQAGTCACSCVLPNVLSCPKSCFDRPWTEETTSEEPWTWTEGTTSKEPWTEEATIEVDPNDVLNG